MKKLILLLMIATFLVLLSQASAVAIDCIFEQYLIDVDCANKAITDDGAKLCTNPENHTVTCLKKPSCMVSGYGVILRNEETGKYTFYKFDEKGDQLAIKLLEATNKTNNIRVQVKGMIGKDMIIKVKSIEEK